MGLLQQTLLALGLTSASVLLLAVFVALQKTKPDLKWPFVFYSLAISLWSAGQATAMYLLDHAASLVAVRICHVGVTLLPVFFAHFAFNLAGSTTQRKRALRLFYLVGIVFLALNATSLLISDVSLRPQLRYIFVPGVAYPALALFLLIVVIYGGKVLVEAYSNSGGLERNQLKYFIWGTAIGYLGALPNFLFGYDVIIPGLMPFGTYAVPLYVGMTTYSIVRYRLLDINLVFTRTVVFALVYASVLGLPLLAALAWEPQLQGAIGPRWWIGLVIVYALLATAAHYVNLHFQHRAEDRILAEERKAHEALRNISQNMMRFLRLNVLLRQIVRTLVNILQLTHAAIYLRPEGENGGSYQRKAVWHHPPRTESDLLPSIPSDSILLEDLRTIRLPRVREELRMHQQGISPKWSAMVDTLSQLQASVVIPVFQQRRLLGILALGEKRSGRIWSQDDLNLLMVLANQAALAIENAHLHEAEEQRLIKEAIEQTAADISYGVSHQFNNRLYVISILASSPVMSLMDKDLDRLPPEETAKWLKKMVQELKKITAEAEMGGQISKGIMSLAKAIPENFKPVEVPPLTEQAADFVRLKHSKEKVEGEELAPTILNGVPKDLPKILGNYAQIHDSIMNLIDNAMDAVREKIYRIHRGELPSPPEPYKGRIQIQAWEKDGWITVTVEDDGIGIEKENMRRIFAPYFTTKATGVKGRGLGGHGLGLYFIKRIMEAHGGRVQAHSEYTKWTRFTVELPIPKEEDLKNADAA